MKLNSSLLAAFAVFGCVHAFKGFAGNQVQLTALLYRLNKNVITLQVSGPRRIQLRKTRSQRARWIGMLDEATAVAPAPKKRSITVEFVQETPGGYICDVDVTNFRTSSSHRIVMSKDQLKQFSELAGKQVEVPALSMYTIKYMIDKGMKLDNTEGMIEASVFPVNYFTLKQLTYFHDDVLEKIVELCKQAPDLTEW